MACCPLHWLQTAQRDDADELDLGRYILFYEASFGMAIFARYHCFGKPFTSDHEAEIYQDDLALDSLLSQRTMDWFSLILG